MAIEFEDRSGHDDGITLCVVDEGKIVHQWEIPSAEILSLAADLSSHIGEAFSKRTLIGEKDAAREAMLRFAALQYLVSMSATMLPPSLRDPTVAWIKEHIEGKRKCPCERCAKARET